MKLIFNLVLMFFTLSISEGSFKKEQLTFSRVQTAYKEKEATIISSLNSHNIDIKNLRIYLRAFKTEKKIELWAKNKQDQYFKIIKEFEICASSGDIGPKRKKGDYQVPEGYYHIDRFNPFSNYYLSLGLNYPNESDKFLGIKNNLGGDIFIHGSCQTIGCMPLDAFIKELYLYCVEARNNGQATIPVTVFPMKLTDKNFAILKLQYREEPQKLGLWEDLKKGYDYFNKNKTLPSIGFLENGRHAIN